MEPISLQICNLIETIDYAIKNKDYKQVKEALIDIKYLQVLNKPKKYQESRKRVKKRPIPDTFNNVLSQVNKVLFAHPMR